MSFAGSGCNPGPPGGWTEYKIQVAPFPGIAMLRRLPLLAVLLATLVGTGCLRGGASNPFVASEGGERSIRIEVRNFNFADATLWALRGGERIRMGVVTGKTDRSFDVRWTVTLPLQIEIDLLAGDRCVTRPMSVDPGEVIQLQIAVDLASSPDCI